MHQADLFVLDEIGFLPYGSGGHNLPVEAYQQMGDDAVAMVTLDRILHHANVPSLKGDSYLMKERLKLKIVNFG